MSTNEFDGLTDAERLVTNALVMAWNAFVKLEVSDADDLNDFRRAIHDAERIILARIVARAYPDAWR